MSPNKKALWLSYDFGITGNYSAFFTYLDDRKAKECGNGLAYFEYETGGADSETMIQNLKKELEQIVKPGPGDRIYAIWKDDTKPNTPGKGRFLFGKRKSAPWNGYGSITENQNDEAD